MSPKNSAYGFTYHRIEGVIPGISMQIYLQQNFGISNFGILNFRFDQTTVNGPATINANKHIWFISNIGYIEPLTPVP